MDPTKKYICIHGHFYQPPRENAWLEVVEKQDSAEPFHDWNERINFECYAPNTAARILDERGFIRKIINNYEYISFNFGPTLLSWLEHADPETHAKIVEADRQSCARFEGHGSAMAQVYNHLIMPLANRRDKVTQVRWGIADFEYRFGRKPEGMWLAETAVDTETLEILVDHGIRFTVLAPRQAKAFRRIGDPNWQEANGGIDPRRPYLCPLPSGRHIALFFYDGVVAQEVAFKGLLNSGKAFAHRLLEAFDTDETPQLVHIATDGESYGHHHRYGEMALADCLDFIAENNLATLTNYPAYLERFPPEYEAQIHENSSWSCVHGVERWRSNCGCTTGSQPGWTQEWRRPLRETLDWLRDRILPLFEKEAARLVKDPWEARDEYIQVLLHRSRERVEAFLGRHARRRLKREEQTRLLRLLEMQRHAMLMYTSCGWFFAEISGIETLQILQYANRVMQYFQRLTGTDLEPEFIARLEAAPSNVFENGAVPYKQQVMNARVDLKRVGMHYAASSLFEEYPEHLEFFNYAARSEHFVRLHGGSQRLAHGRTVMESKITFSEKHFSFAVLYLGQQNILGSISTDMPLETYRQMAHEVEAAFESTNLGEVITLMERYFGEERFTIWHLFRDEKRKILQQILERSLNEIENAVRTIYDDNYQLMAGMLRSNIPIPEAWKHAAQFIVNRDMYRFFANGRMTSRELRRLADEYRKWGLQFSDEPALKLIASERLFREIQCIGQEEVPLEHLQHLNEILEVLGELGLQPDLWQSQNAYYSLMKGFSQGKWVFANAEWEREFMRLGEWLRVRVTPAEATAG